ncbi:diguanylate cyclase (GGDEF)-like protein [Rhizobium subbaraonis]|uniref:diguanylate cyclase n=1 Tax=Rhizobium subbaraonis TaxID=908946 RepID=A0A285U171_9HYPH|nr:diguanylate cyclase [Rhizobium subbaraonis]SOC35572.1 diguanylate cyclase (GGDEF)-like protein [Rhizobium subbaraonis]
MRFVHFRLVGPAIACITLLIAGLATIPYLGVARIDAEARQQQETLVESNIALWISDIEFSLTAWTIWDEAIANLDNRFDREWTDRNIGASLIGTSRTRFTAVLDPADAILYSRTAATVQDRPFFARGATAIVAESGPLVAAVRAREHATVRNGIPLPVAASRIEVLGDEAVLLSASLFQPDFATAVPKGDRAPILVTAMPIDGSLQDFFGQRFLLDDPQVGPLSAVAANRARAEIAVSPEGQVQVLSWRPPTPAADVLYHSLPLVVAVSLVLLAGGLLMFRMTRGTAQMLVDREREMRHAATHDFLTGLINRALLEPEFKALANRRPLAVVCMDLDGFKAVNDTHGHAIGDALLRVVAARLRSGTRQADRIFRLGGDEFAILMPDLSATEAEQVCNTLLAALSQPIVLPVGETSIGASFGISLVVDAGTTCDAAFNAADAALYRAKSLGRGRVAMAASIGVRPPQTDRRVPWADACAGRESTA